jgi:hypothetical protein
MSDAASLSIDALAQRCAQETEKYFNREHNDTQYCFELLRRAFGQGHPDAIAHVYRTYERRILGWVYSHGHYARTGEDAEFFASWAFFTCCTALRGEKFERFPSVAHVLKYLRMCVHTAIMHYLRNQPPAQPLSVDNVVEPTVTVDFDGRVDASDLWEHVARLLPDDRDRLLAHCFLVQDLKPRQIVAAFPEMWHNEREVSVAIYRIRQLLRNDLDIRGRAGLGGG